MPQFFIFFTNKFESMWYCMSNFWFSNHGHVRQYFSLLNLSNFRSSLYLWKAWWLSFTINVHIDDFLYYSFRNLRLNSRIALFQCYTLYRIKCRLALPFLPAYKSAKIGQYNFIWIQTVEFVHLYVSLHVFQLKPSSCQTAMLNFWRLWLFRNI